MKRIILTLTLAALWQVHIGAQQADKAPDSSPLACATTLFSLPGAEYMHKIVPEEGSKIVSVDLGALTTLSLQNDREKVGNRYLYVHGTAPTKEGNYSYLVRVQQADGSMRKVPVQLHVSRHLQSPTPMMGWLTWNWFAREISHTKVVDIVKGMQKKGLIDAGYRTIVLDDAWATNQSDKAQLTYDRKKFPKGIAGFVQDCKAVNKDVVVGIYSDAGSMTCEGYQPGSYKYESQHVALFDSWGVDMLKYDFCNNEDEAFASYKAMGREIAKLNQQRAKEGRPVFVYNICEWGTNSPWTWGAEAGGSSWRATNDAREDWVGTFSRPGVLGGVDIVRDLWMYAGVNHYNDLDMMAIGLHGLGGPSNNTAENQENGGIIKGLTDEQARTQMSLWCMLSSPLALTCDLRQTPHAEANQQVGKLPAPLITKADLETLCNKSIIAINQDSLGQQAEYMIALSTGTTDFSNTGYDVYMKDLTGGRKAVAVTNRSDNEMLSVVLKLSNLYMSMDDAYDCEDVWTGEKGVVAGSLSTGEFKPYETKVFVLSPR